MIVLLFVPLNLSSVQAKGQSYINTYTPSKCTCKYSLMTQPICNMSPLNSNDLHRIFEKLDKNGDGLVSLEELNSLLERIGVQYSLDELESLVGKSSLDFNEFLLFYDSISKRNNSESEGIEEEDDEVEEEGDLVKAFKVFDLNDDGYISSEELQSVLSRLGLWEENCGRDCKSMIHMYDTNSDGKLDFEEFKNMMYLTIS